MAASPPCFQTIEGVRLLTTPLFDLAIVSDEDGSASRYLAPWGSCTDLVLRRPQSITARALARWLLQKRWGLAPQQWHIHRAEGGAPVLVGEEGLPVPHLSFSHRGNWIGCGLCWQGSIGIDLELPTIKRDANRLAQAFLSVPEQQSVQQDGEAALLAFWTLRESFAKSQGQGLATALSVVPAQLLTARQSAVECVWNGSLWFCQHDMDYPLHWAVVHRVPLSTRLRINEVLMPPNAKLLDIR
ncbi:MAG: 4'-phosphopantetheinyl transferase superfamily protein [Magnetococcales bacterium]|nr:4'-phosphopantetheinyl transferase superfamily protein [Magnetococcales bacterium]MBF0114065.1 4'-phosphopantetheinyl transferase superfamily protein [Magnetococcales bacterium]